MNKPRWKREESMSPQYLRETLSYDSKTGVLTWMVRPRNHFSSANAERGWNTKYSGKKAGAVGTHGYVQVQFKGNLFMAHRIAWCLHFGAWPKLSLDHINLDKTDNRIANLREATNSENSCNRSIQSNNFARLKGAHYQRRNNSWFSTITVNKKRHYLGCFRTKEEAAEAYAKASLKFHKDFARPQ